MQAVNLIIHGRVQGVWFRASAQETALNLGLSGWVRNTSQGAVEVFIQGDDTSVDQMVTWCHRGPSGARVDRVEVRPSAKILDLQGFHIRYA